MEPTLLPLNAEMTAFYTFFSVHGREFSFNIVNVPQSSQGQKVSLKNAKLEGDSELRSLLAGLEPLVQQRLNQSIDVGSFVLEMKDILEQIAGDVKTKFSLPSAEFYRRVYTEELPSMFELQWSNESTLKDVLNQFSEMIKKFQDFWHVMEDIDMNVWVMEPLHPSLASSFRRIALGGHCSLSLTLNAFSARFVPECRFFGSDLVIAPLRKKWNSNIGRWKTDRLLRENLEDVLEITFPSPQDSMQEDISAECGICYAFRLPNADGLGADRGCVPDRACDNPTCGRPFHSSCLMEWLRSITTTRQSFDVLFGNCPYCSHPIAVKTTAA